MRKTRSAFALRPILCAPDRQPIEPKVDLSDGDRPVVRRRWDIPITGGLGGSGRRSAVALAAGGGKGGAGGLKSASARTSKGAFSRSFVKLRHKCKWRRRRGRIASGRRAGERLKASGTPLRGILHAAAALEDDRWSADRPRAFRSVLAAKASGAFHLHELTQALLDFFVLYSIGDGVARLLRPGQLMSLPTPF
jgi:hypothetical protein